MESGQKPSDMKLSGLCINSEKLRNLHYKNFVFLDSLTFLDGSLDKVVQDLRLSNHDFPILKKSLPDNEQFELISGKKGVFCYSYLTSLDEFRQMTEIPPKEAFYNDLSEKHISSQEHEHAKKVFKAFHCRTMEDYLLVYNYSDVVLLLEGLLYFREEIYANFQLDVFQYISNHHYSKTSAAAMLQFSFSGAPQLSFDCYLKTTKTKIGLVSDPWMAAQIERGIRGGNSFVRQRYSRQSEDSVLSYVDA